MIVSDDHKTDLIKIAKKLIKKKHSIPTDVNGEPTATYIKYLSLIYSPEIANIAQFIPVTPGNVNIDELSEKVNLTKEILISKLDEPARRRFILAFGENYSLPTPFLLFDAPFFQKEIYEGPDGKKFADISRKFFIDDHYYKKWETSWRGTPYMRVLTINEQIESEREITPLEEVYKILDDTNSFAVVPCPCRLRADISDVRECTDKYPLENCIQLGPNAEMMTSVFGGRKISRDKAKAIVKESAEVGLVLATDNTSKFTSVICSCCECCCGIIRGLTRFDNPRAIAKANFVSTIDEDNCTACETCLERCKFGAIEVDDYAKISIEKCVGCGLCAVKCPSDAITMKRYERETIPG
jgi:Pyruvate/2-oxoacid:ferredoxin oxidoreductase delta subunit